MRHNRAALAGQAALRQLASPTPAATACLCLMCHRWTRMQLNPDLEVIRCIAQQQQLKGRSLQVREEPAADTAAVVLAYHSPVRQPAELCWLPLPPVGARKYPGKGQATARHAKFARQVRRQVPGKWHLPALNGGRASMLCTRH